MSDALDTLREKLLAANDFEAMLTAPRVAPEDGVVRVDARVITLKGERRVQLNRRTATQSFQENVAYEDGVERVLVMLPAFKQGVFTLPDTRVHALVNRRGEVALRRQAGSFAVAAPEHDKRKARVLSSSKWQQALGLLNEEGGTCAGMGDKLRQIDHFTRIVKEALTKIKQPYEVIDLCCGKGYLTFAVAQLLRDMGLESVRITGMDLKGDVIKQLSVIARDAGVDNLRFLEGDIANCPAPERPPFILSLHACDTATDIVLAKAVGWRAPLILAAPCCQHELHKQVDNALLRPLLKHPLFKERYAALLTDALRCELLERQGYSVDVLEFIDPLHTPKNTLLRAIYTGKTASAVDYTALRDAMHVSPAMEKLLLSKEGA